MMVMAHKAFEQSVPLYAVGALDREQRQALEMHLLTGCAACHAVIREYQAVAGVLPYELPRVAPPPQLKMTIMAALAQDPSQPEPPKVSNVSGTVRPIPIAPSPPTSFLSRGALRSALVLVSVLLLAGTVLYAWSLRSQITGEAAERQRVESALQQETARIAALQRQIADQDRQLAGLREEFGSRVDAVSELRETVISREVELDLVRARLAQLEQETAGLRRTVAQRDEMLTFLRSPNVKVISLVGLEPARSAGALLLLDPESKKAFFYGYNLPPLPAGKIYQLWAIAVHPSRGPVAPGEATGTPSDGYPISAGTFSPDAGQKSRLVIRALPDLSRLTKFAVSLEPEGGPPQPTGEFYLAGPL